MAPYTVLLLRGGAISDGPADTYLAWVEADDPLDAVFHARVQAIKANFEDEAPDYDAHEDYIPLAVFVGHLEDLCSM